MDKKQENNYAFIDGTNLHKGICELGWRLDYKRFRVWLTDKYLVNRAYIFVGFIAANTSLYRDLQNWGYTIVFKQALLNKQGETKGNCDAEMVLQTVSDMYEKNYDKAVIVTGDGDFACLASFLNSRSKLAAVLSPSHEKASVLLRKAVPEKILFLGRFKDRLEYIKDRQRTK